jgi:excisionase family DNA binding protein
MTELVRDFQREGLSVPEACEVAGLGRTKIYEAIAAGELKARKYGKRRIILREDLRAFLAGLPVDVPSRHSEAPQALAHR